MLATASQRGSFLKDSKRQFLYLTTEGWKTKTPHRIEIWYVRHEGKFYLISQYRDEAHWVQNIKNHPRILFEVDGDKYAGLGRVVDVDDEPELAKKVSELMEAKYQWSEGLIVELRPEPGVLQK
jgi:deazaflavin-dependent oxidoreductase (nitroreductase family)